MQIKLYNTIFSLSNLNNCPHCHVKNHPKYLWSEGYEVNNRRLLVQSAWRCSNDDCSKIIILETVYDNFKFVNERFLNGLPLGPAWPKPIVNLASGNSINKETVEQSRFIKTYLQSLEAEHKGLDEIAGMGYRKSIEYLVKDWAIQSKPEDKEKIEGFWLGQVIATYYVGDLKDILERATWLGNDQSHYNKLFNEYDLNDLKELIDLIMVELDRQHKMKHYIETIQKRK